MNNSSYLIGVKDSFDVHTQNVTNEWTHQEFSTYVIIMKGNQVLHNFGICYFTSWCETLLRNYATLGVCIGILVYLNFMFI